MTDQAVTAPPGTFKRLLLRKFGARHCDHFFRVVVFRGRMFLKCDHCIAETEGFRIYQPLKGGR